MARVLVVDDKEMMRESLTAILSRSGHAVHGCQDASSGLEWIAGQSVDVIVTDLKMPGMDGLAFLGELSRRDCDASVIVMTAYATIETAVQAMRSGAFDYIQKPFEAEEIVLLVERAAERKRLLADNEAYRVTSHDRRASRELIGRSSAMQQVMDTIEKVAASSVTVLIRGESGTGKEMIAEAIHRLSPRADRPFLAVNCAALSTTLLESELFGHEKGAFTGADRTRKGRFELADNGTLLLDEISEMNLQLQAKLLRVLQERAFERVGSSVTRHVDVRVLATTNRPLEQWVREGRFREDLFYRLNVVPVELPPLRYRVQEDVEPLCEYFLRRSADREGRPLRRLSGDALSFLKHYGWPGNVRELENLMERVSIMASSELVTRDMLQSWLTVGSTPGSMGAVHGGLGAADPTAGAGDPAAGAADPAVGAGDEVVGVQSRESANGGGSESAATIARNDACESEVEISPDMSLADVERKVIELTLDRYNGHRQKTAHALGIGVRTLGMKLKRWREDDQADQGSSSPAETSSATRATTMGREKPATCGDQAGHRSKGGGKAVPSGSPRVEELMPSR